MSASYQPLPGGLGTMGGTPCLQTQGFTTSLVVALTGRALSSDEAEQVWCGSGRDGGGRPHDLYMDIGEEVRFRVVDESQDTSPTGPSSAEATSSSEELPKKAAPLHTHGELS